jgi:hypothetical protein
MSTRIEVGGRRFIDCRSAPNSSVSFCYWICEPRRSPQALPGGPGAATGSPPRLPVDFLVRGRPITDLDALCMTRPRITTSRPVGFRPPTSWSSLSVRSYQVLLGVGRPKQPAGLLPSMVGHRSPDCRRQRRELRQPDLNGELRARAGHRGQPVRFR